MDVVEYNIQRGDTLGAIARDNGSTVAELADLNNIENPDLIIAGETLRIPNAQAEVIEGSDAVANEAPETPQAPVDDAQAAAADVSGSQENQVFEEPETNYVDPEVYTIERGDTLNDLAARHDRAVEELRAANNIENPDLIIAGEELVIPARESDTTNRGSERVQPQAQPANLGETRRQPAAQPQARTAPTPTPVDFMSLSAQEMLAALQMKLDNLMKKLNGTDTNQNQTRRSQPVRTAPQVAGSGGTASTQGIDNSRGVDAFELEVIRLVNEIRAQHGLQQLSYEQVLDTTAYNHARHMASQIRMAHDGIGDGTAESRVRSVGWSGAWGENVARGQTTPQQVVNEWMASASHKKNILDPRWNKIAVQKVTAADGQIFWAQNFGRS